MKASIILLMLSWLPPLAAYELVTEPVGNAAPPLELAAVSFTPTAAGNNASILAADWVQPLAAPAEAASNAPYQPVAEIFWHAVTNQAGADFLKSDPLSISARRSHVPEPTTTAVLGVASLALFSLFRNTRQRLRSA